MASIVTLRFLMWPSPLRFAMLKLFDQFLYVISAITKYVMLVMASSIFIIILFTVFSRYLFDFVLHWSEEVPRYLLVWIGFLGAALAVDKKEHIGFDYIFNLIPDTPRRILGLLLNLGIAVIALIMVVYGINFCREFGGDWMESIPFTNIWFYTALPVSGVLMLLYVIRDEIRGIIDFKNRHRE